jgi:hypothetical protein
MAAVKSQSVLEKLESINKKQEEQIQNLETKAIQLTNLYFVFQGVVLSSISSASPVKCNHWWIPFCLSLIAALLNFISIFSTIHYFLKCSEELDQNYEDVHEMILRQRRTTGDGGCQANDHVQLQSCRRDHQESVTQRMLDTRAHANDHVQLQSYRRDHQESVTQRMLDTRAHANDHVQLQSSRSEQEGDRNRPKPDPVKQRKRRVLCYAAMGLLLGFSCIILYGCRALLCDTPKDKCVKLC